MLNKIKTAIIGASGYTGLELLKILGRHSYANIEFITSNTYKNVFLSELQPDTAWPDLKFKATEEITPDDFEKTDAVFLCLPPHMSMQFVKQCLLSFKGTIIDIGSDFRLDDASEYLAWYGKEHTTIEMLESFVYGLPELNYEKIKEAKNIANPGCYPTSVLLGLAPVMMLCKCYKEDQTNMAQYPGCGFFSIKDINIDSKSGVSGAGKKLKNEYLFCSINENFYAYSPVGHRHTGEIEQELEKLSGNKIPVSFTPHLLPVDRGIFTSVYCKLDININKDSKRTVCVKKSLNLKRPGVKAAEVFKCPQINTVFDLKGLEDTPGNTVQNSNTCPGCDEKITESLKGLISSVYEWYYRGSRFVSFKGEKIPQLKDVVNTNSCHIGFSFDERTSTLKIFSVIDNLLKGAAGQAVQNMNIKFGFKEEEGLNG